jgi:hypothetical protein
MVQADASFCGQCGSNLRVAGGAGAGQQPASVSSASVPVQPDLPDVPDLPDLITPEPLVTPDPLVVSPEVASPVQPAAVAEPAAEPAPTTSPDLAAHQPTSPPTPSPQLSSGATRLQQQTARLLHVQTNASLELPQNLTVIHIGKPNDRIPPDIDVSGFPDSEIVSRIHADIRLEGDAFYIEDIGSSNGTYINNVPLPMGNRHRLRPGDRISLGKGDKVSFLFQLS